MATRLQHRLCTVVGMHQLDFVHCVQRVRSLNAVCTGAQRPRVESSWLLVEPMNIHCIIKANDYHMNTSVMTFCKYYLDSVNSVFIIPKF